MDQKIPMTLSIGMASGGSNVVEVGQWVQAALDIALGRGGDQAAVRVGQRQTFYGGKTNAVEKRTRVRARVVAHALRDLMKDSDNIVIMGHKTPDMDSIGAAIGVLKAAEALNKEAYIVLEGVNPSIQKMMDLIREEPALHERFISPEHALGLIGPRSLAVVVDTHRESLLKEPRLLAETERIVIIDHHRRSEEFIANPVLVYMEPYASSTCELVTELLQYIHDRISLDDDRGDGADGRHDGRHEEFHASHRRPHVRGGVVSAPQRGGSCAHPADAEGRSGRVHTRKRRSSGTPSFITTMSRLQPPNRASNIRSC